MFMTTSGRDRRTVLLAHSYFMRHDPKQLERMKPYPPLATLITAGVIRERGFDVALFDAMIANGVDDFAAMLDQVRPAVVGILEDGFNYLTKMCTLRTRTAAQEMIALARARGCRVAVSSSDAGDHPEHYLAAGADAVITGAVEPAFLELCQLWTADLAADASGIAGLALPTGSPRQAGAGQLHVLAQQVRRTAARPPLRDLDCLPLPAWDLVDVAVYRALWRAAHARFSWNMAASRGCPYGCNWCAKPLFGRRYAQRSPRAVAAELGRLRAEVAPDHIWFADDIFGLTAPWIRSFADEVSRLRARTPFMIQTRASLMSGATVQALVEAGAEEVWLGVESGSQRILDAMDKGTTVAQIREATRNLKGEGVRVGWFIQLGYLGEEWPDVRQTRALIATERPNEIGVSVSYPLPHTVFYEKVRAHMGSKQNWEHTGDLDMLFHGTYTAAFYRELRDLLHAEVSSWTDCRAVTDFEAVWHELDGREAGYRQETAERA